jgi:GT2 family glycosyltransferase
MKTACILLNYRDPKEIFPLIESVESCRWPDKEIYVVENGTGPEAVQILQERVGRPNIVSTPVNLGFAGGMNLGVRHAMNQGAEFLWMLSKDITVEPDCLEKLHSLWPRLQRPGLLGSLTDLNGTDQVYFFRGKIDTRGNVSHGNKGRSIPQIPELRDEYGHTDYVNGSCIFMHRSVIEKIGAIPEDYFLYFEDCEFGLRAQRAGYTNYTCYTSRVHHRRAVNEFNWTAEYYCRRNSFAFKKRNGFTKPWTKVLELIRARKNTLKCRLRANEKLLEVLRAVERDIRTEQMGPGPWR